MAHVIQNSDIAQRAQEIERLIINHDLSVAGMRLLDFATDFDESNKHRNEIIVMISMIRNLLDEERMRKLNRNDAIEEKSKYLNQMLEIKEMIERKKESLIA